MSEARIDELEERIQQEGKRFLMEKYVSMLLLQIKPSDGDGEDVPLDDQTVGSLQAARPYVGLPLGEQIAELLRAEGHEVDELEEEDDSDAEETDADGDADEIVAEGDTEGLFDGEDDGAVAVGAADGAGADDADDVGLFDDETTSAGDNGQRGEAATEVTGDEEADGEEPTEEDETAGVLFGSDIYSGGFTPTEGHEVGETPGFTPTEGHEVEETPGFTPTEGHQVKETPGFTATEGHEVEETPGFTPTEGHQVKETPGFTATEGHEVEETPGFTPTEGHQVKETPGFTATEGHEVEETPGFTPTEGHQVKETPGFTATEGHEVEETPGFTPTEGHQVKETPGFTANADAETKRLQARKERQERLKQIQEERRVRLKLAQQAGAESDVRPSVIRSVSRADSATAGEVEEEEVELELDNLLHQISLDDLEQYLDITIIPDDRNRLQRRWQQKMRDPSIRHLLDDKGAMAHGYALIPRVPRYIRGGQTVPTNLLNLVRSFPQLFDNVAQVINKYRTEGFFIRETPELDWAIIAVEALPESRGRNYMEQKAVIKQYAQKHQTNERRIPRRRLIDALYDCIVINAITKDEVLSKTVDLTETKVGPQNFVCINFGDKGIRINEVNRQQGHQQMGMCPSW